MFYDVQQLQNVIYDSTKTADRVEIVDGSGSQITSFGGSSSSTSSTSVCTNVSGSASSVTLLASNTSRKGAVIYNDSSAVLYIKFGTTASTTSYTVQVASQGYFELPIPVYTGEIDGIWASATGAARVTELT